MCDERGKEALSKRSPIFKGERALESKNALPAWPKTTNSKSQPDLKVKHRRESQGRGARQFYFSPERKRWKASERARSRWK